MNAELLRRIIKSYRSRDDEGFVSAVQKLIESERKQGHVHLAKDLSNLLNNGHGHQLTRTTAALAHPPSDLFDETPETMLRVSVTLAYRAPVRKTNRRYRGTILEWKFAKRGESLAQFRQRCSAGHAIETDEGEDEAEEQAIGDWNWTIGSRLRTRGTVQKDWFEAPAADFGDELLLAVIGRRGWLSKERQDAGFDQTYAVSICIEAIGVVVPIHEAIEARVRIPIPGA